MSNLVWVNKQNLFCDRRKEIVHLLEERVYPADAIPDGAQPYRVRSQKCSEGVACNLAGYRCRWSGLNPVYDPFYDIETTGR